MELKAIASVKHALLGNESVERHAPAMAGTSTAIGSDRNVPLTPIPRLPARRAVTLAMDIQALLAAKAEEVRNVLETLGAHVPGEILVRSKDGASLQSLERSLDAYGVEAMRRLDFPGPKNNQAPVLHLRLGGGLSVAEAIVALRSRPDVAYAIPNHVYHLDAARGPVDPHSVPNDLSDRLWGLHNTGQNGGTPDADIDAPEAWQINEGSRDGPIVAVIDTGVDYNHPDLRANMWTNPGEIPGDGIDNDNNGVVDDVVGFNAFAETGDPLDGHSHDSHCSGTIGAVGNNGEGVVGVNQEARIMAVKIFNDSGSTTADAIVRGINYATRMGARITSNSWGGGAANEAIREAFARSPALHITAAGNSGTDNDATPHYPSSYDLPNIVAVAATDRNDRLASFSCYGQTSVDLGAPGVDIYSTTPNGGYGDMSGTSMATPHVAGAAVLIATHFPDATNDEIVSRLLSGTDTIPALAGKVVTGGRLNVANALATDDVPPGAVGDFACTDVTHMSARLAWIAPGDDGTEGRASRYVVKMATSPIVDGSAGGGEISFNDAPQVPTQAPAAAGSPETLDVGLPPASEERRLYFAIKAFDNVGNASPMATTRVTIPPLSGIVFEDDGENGLGQWTPEGSWGLQAEDGRGQVFADSPYGAYDNNVNASLTSRAIDLTNVAEPRLYIELRHELESGFDHLHVEAARIHPDGSESWQQLEKLSGSSDWKGLLFELGNQAGGPAKLRLRLTTDGSVTRDGVFIDRVLVSGRGDTTPPGRTTDLRAIDPRQAAHEWYRRQ